MEDRYEMRGKLGQGGLGAVFRAWDHALKREVAVKRILSGEAGEQRDEATRQMEKETGALAALQHPNIVTIYDVGSDEEGPFVVMELLTGETLDEIVAKAPLTWRDFRELVLQIQEGLVAAQDLGLVHRDLKPSNVMVNWLPSGRFQAKIVDFGLAKFCPKPEEQTVDLNDSVFGSIFFMAPEQFERGALDSRVDMYAIGSVYYYTLTGQSPFQGDTGPQVMAAHLEHRVIPLGQLRPDIPKWAADWVMWHINRLPDERPENARESLKSFIQLDVPTTQSMAPAEPQPEAPKRPRLVIPGAAPPPEPTPVPEPAITQTAPQPLAPPSGAPPSLHTTSQQSAAEANPEPSPAAPPPAATVMPATAVTVTATPTGPAARTQAAGTRPAGGQPSMVPAKKGLGNGAKGAIAAVLGVVVLIIAGLLANKAGESKKADLYNRIVKQAAESSDPIPVNAEELKILLESVVTPGSNAERETVYKALYLAEAADSTDIDDVLVDAATTTEMNSSIREALLSRIVAQRKNPSVIPKLLAFARNTNDEKGATAALEAVKKLGGGDQFAELLDVVQFTGNTEIRKAAEAAAGYVVSNSPRPQQFAGTLASAYAAATSEDTRHALLRLLGRAGGANASAIVTKSLKEGSDLDKQSAIFSIQQWVDDSMFETLTNFMVETDDERLRATAFKAAMVFMRDKTRKRSEEASEAFWKILAERANNPSEQLDVIRSLVNLEPKAWSMAIVEGFTDPSGADKVVDIAEKGLRLMKSKMKEDE
ncbi:serine/threonine-protein kinase [Luteolibacter marinus]|uniref:serine/threonine-protein kinase n=1 Tax=Luteolibacter marinus TaxID=2776705 RepID=UPI0018664FA4|nr:serine/threonine-protein kinase [Luteolibacter marinus]